MQPSIGFSWKIGSRTPSTGVRALIVLLGWFQFSHQLKIKIAKTEREGLSSLQGFFLLQHGQGLFFPLYRELQGVARRIPSKIFTVRSLNGIFRWHTEIWSWVWKVWGLLSKLKEKKGGGRVQASSEEKKRYHIHKRGLTLFLSKKSLTIKRLEQQVFTSDKEFSYKYMLKKKERHLRIESRCFFSFPVGLYLLRLCCHFFSMREKLPWKKWQLPRTSGVFLYFFERFFLNNNSFNLHGRFQTFLPLHQVAKTRVVGSWTRSILPKRVISRATVIRSPFVYKSSREQFEERWSSCQSCWRSFFERWNVAYVNTVSLFPLSEARGVVMGVWKSLC